MKRWLICVALALPAFLLGACGSSASGDPPLPAGSLAVSGSVSLPTGSKLNPSDLKVVSSLHTSSLNAGGQFKTGVSAQGATLHQLVDANDRVVMLGFLRVDAAGQALASTIDARSTATVLGFYALGGFTYPATYYETLLTVIDKSTSLAALTKLLETKIAGNPTVLNGADADIAAALAALRSEVYPAIKRTSSSRIARPLATSDAVDFGTILVSPGNSQSGVTVNIGEGSIYLTNEKRRDTAYYIFRTGYLDGDGVYHTITPNQAIVENDILPSTVKLNGTFGTLLDLSNGTVAYAPVNGPSVTLPLVPATGKRTDYRLVTMGASLNPSVPTWWDKSLEQAAVSVRFKSWMKDLILPTFFSWLFPSSQISAVYADPKFADFLNSYLKFCTSNLPDLSAQLSNGQLKEASHAFLAAMAGDTTFRNGLLDALTSSGLLDAALKSQSGGVLDRMVRANRVLDAVDQFLEKGDMAVVLGDYATSDMANQWTISVTRPNVRLQPESPTVTKDQKLELKCTTGTSGTVVYNWSTTGTYGYLEDDRGHTGSSFDSTMQQVRYVADKAADNKSDTVTVKAYLIPEYDTSKRLYLGSATSTITGKLTVSYTLAGNAAGTSSFVVDDGLDVYVNGTRVYSDGTRLSGYRGPISITAKKGDSLRLVVRDTYGLCSSMGSVYLVAGSSSQQLTPGFNLGCGRAGGDQGIVFDQTFTIPF